MGVSIHIIYSLQLVASGNMVLTSQEIITTISNKLGAASSKNIVSICCKPFPSLFRKRVACFQEQSGKNHASLRCYRVI